MMVNSLTLICIIGIIVFFAITVFLVYFTTNTIQLSSSHYSEFNNGLFLFDSEESITSLTEDARLSYERAKIWQERHPPDSIPTDITPPQFLSIQEKGVSAFEFEGGDPDTNVFVAGRTELQFVYGECCIQTNLPLPRQQEVYYWEAKIFEKPESTTISVGVATKPYPTWRLPGWNRYSIGYFSNNGYKYFSSPFNGKPYGIPFDRGDTIGVGYKHRTGSIFFTRNGKRLEDAYTGLRWNLFPTIGANGPCQIHVNLGQAGFVFLEANVKKWGLAPSQGTLAPPPAYGSEQDTILLASTSSIHQLQLIPSSSYRCPNRIENDDYSLRTYPSSAVLITVNDINHSQSISEPPPYSSQDNLLD
ncbi:concanavalin A-like lectin/glucanase domain-containing protein [Cokeromyces recurvatus]|uniref:concanavalin A-like lectin/glucanase domain-containing protein n=1 Tax=Cokeromyces recurvatus TaxID=90255 RepID=UPI00222082AA|nr:concanavalin A-like lectin/glucanase domain-containing protein [Cokeromyces recurvatus]KAI7905534.1 concanavalin A-like lectin/glucanase domain-containing protein [Cokeromyces recurvatus]